MNSAVCTLFEGDYHYGVAALANSLHHSGFRGKLYAGYRGDFPQWAITAMPSPLQAWPSARTLQLDEGIELVFLPVTTNYHLTNYKADFMLALLDGPAVDTESLFYLDPDICVAAPWTYFEDWVSCGVAVCEDMNSPLPENHPRRAGWRRYFSARGQPLRFRGTEYVNGGFVGLRIQDKGFLETWSVLMHHMAEEIGSLAAAKINGGAAYKTSGFADCFDCSDQDALNATLEATDRVISVVGQEAMGFRPGRALLPHAVGGSKPWQRNYLRSALNGVPPRLIDKAFWRNVASPIKAYGDLFVEIKRIDITCAAAIGRFVRRTG